MKYASICIALALIVATCFPGQATSEPNQSEAAAQLFKAGKFSEAGDIYARIVAQDPKDYSAVLQLGRVALLANRLDDFSKSIAALVQDLKERGLLQDTLVVWGGEFGRTVYCQGKLTPENYGRDHHPRCFTVWLSGGGVKPGISFGETDDYGYNVVKDPVHVHDLHATILHLLGFDHEKFTFRYAGRDFRLTDVYGHVVKSIIA